MQSESSSPIPGLVRYFADVNMAVPKNRILVMDNGAYSIKVGHASDERPRVVPNCVMKVKNERRRAFVGSQIEECRDTSGLYYMLPCERGYLVRWDIQKNVWDYIFGNDFHLGVDLDSTELIFTEPLFNFRPIRDGLAELFFEDFGIPAWVPTSGPDLTAWKWRKDTGCMCCVVVDCGYSFSHVVPFSEGKRLDNAIKRLDVGGKLLTNYLTEIVSYRQLNVMEETFVMNQVKEDSCFVSMDFNADMKAVLEKRNSIVREYVLPDYLTLKRGYLREPSSRQDPNEQILVLGNERFTVPELLFHPSDAGLPQMGIAELIVNVVEKCCPEETRAAMYKNIVVTGGSTVFPNFKERLMKDVRALAKDCYDVAVYLADDPVTSHWSGGSAFAASEDYMAQRLTRKEYEERGGSNVMKAYSTGTRETRRSHHEPLF